MWAAHRNGLSTRLQSYQVLAALDTLVVDQVLVEPVQVTGEVLDVGALTEEGEDSPAFVDALPELPGVSSNTCIGDGRANGCHSIG